MRSHFKLLVTFLACVLSLLPVLHVNNALDIAEIARNETPGAPVIKFSIDDPCNAIMDVLVTVEVIPDQLRLSIASSVVDQPVPCKNTPYALVTTESLHLKTGDGRIVERSFSLKTGPTSATTGTLERASGSSSFAVPLRGDSDARFQISPGALDAGFGESSVQVQLMARNLTCPDPNATTQEQDSSIQVRHCAIPLRAILQYANSAYDVAAALPPTYYLGTGPTFGRPGSTKSYPTTRLIWAERATAPSSVIKGTLTGFEIHLMDRHSVALKQFITVAGSAIFGTFVSMLLAFRAPTRSRPNESTAQRGVDTREAAGTKPAAGSPPTRQAAGPVLPSPQIPTVTPSEVIESPAEACSRRVLAPEASTLDRTTRNRDQPPPQDTEGAASGSNSNSPKAVPASPETQPRGVESSELTTESGEQKDARTDHKMPDSNAHE